MPDLFGFGRSDKPVDQAAYSYDMHARSIEQFALGLDLRELTIVVHDWGGPIGLRVAVEHADRVSRLVVMDTGVWTGRQRMSEAWQAFAGFVRSTEDLPIGQLVRGGCLNDPGDAVIAAWLSLEDAAAESGVRRHPAQTPTEFTLAILRSTRADADATRELLALYHLARFSTHPVTADHVERAWRCLGAIAESWVAARAAGAPGAGASSSAPSSAPASGPSGGPA